MICIIPKIDLVQKKEVPYYENDISAEEEIESESSRIQSKNEHSRRKKSLSCKKSKRKKSIVSIGRSFVAFSSSIRKFFKGRQYDIFRIPKKVR